MGNDIDRSFNHMIMRALTPSGDWCFGAGLGSYTSTDLAIRENIQTRLLSWVGNCFFDLRAGIDWMGRLDVGQQKTLEYELHTLILQSYGVVGINSFSVSYSSTTRYILITYDIRTIFSPSFQSTVTMTAGS